MARNKKRDAWVAHIRVCVPIDAQDVGSIQRAQQKVAEIANLIPGSTVEITHAGFGRMAAQAPAPPQTGWTGTPADFNPAPTPEPEIPAPLRRVPRPAPNGPDGAA